MFLFWVIVRRVPDVNWRRFNWIKPPPPHTHTEQMLTANIVWFIHVLFLLPYKFLDTSLCDSSLVRFSKYRLAFRHPWHARLVSLCSRLGFFFFRNNKKTEARNIIRKPDDAADYYLFTIVIKFIMPGIPPPSCCLDAARWNSASAQQPSVMSFPFIFSCRNFFYYLSSSPVFLFSRVPPQWNESGGGGCISNVSNVENDYPNTHTHKVY